MMGCGSVNAQSRYGSGQRPLPRVRQVLQNIDTRLVSRSRPAATALLNAGVGNYHCVVVALSVALSVAMPYGVDFTRGIVLHTVATSSCLVLRTRLAECIGTTFWWTP
jgi:hypothetical protein